MKCARCGHPLPALRGSLFVKAIEKELCSVCLRAYYRKDKELYRMVNIAEDAGIPRSTIDCIITDFNDEPEE